MIGRFCGFTDPLDQLVVTLHVGPRLKLYVTKLIHRWRLHQTSGETHRIDQSLSVQRVGQEIETNSRCLMWVHRLDVN